MPDRPSHTHITLDVLRAARRGRLDHEDLARMLLDTLGDLCPECRAVITEAGEEVLPLTIFDRTPFDRLDLREALERYDADLETAPALFDQLRDRTPEQRLLLIQNVPGRFANLVLTDEILDLSRDCLPDDPAASLGWARTAQALAATREVPHDAHLVRALALQGNAHRAMDDFATATELLYRAHGVMQGRTVADLDLAAELHGFLASLNSDRDRFEQAAEHLEQAVAILKLLRDDAGLARVHMKQGILSALRGHLEAARAADRAAIGLLSPHTEPELYLAARLNLAFHLEESGDVRTAQDILGWDAQQHGRHGNAHTRVRVEWLEARLCVHRGEVDRAERIFRRLRNHFAGKGQGFDAALVAQELAALH